MLRDAPHTLAQLLDARAIPRRKCHREVVTAVTRVAVAAFSAQASPEAVPTIKSQGGPCPMIPRHAKPSTADNVALSSALLHREGLTPVSFSPIKPIICPILPLPVSFNPVIPQSPNLPDCARPTALFPPREVLIVIIPHTHTHTHLSIPSSCRALHQVPAHGSIHCISILARILSLAPISFLPVAILFVFGFDLVAVVPPTIPTKRTLCDLRAKDFAIHKHQTGDHPLWPSPPPQYPSQHLYSCSTIIPRHHGASS